MAGHSDTAAVYSAEGDLQLAERVRPLLAALARGERSPEAMLGLDVLVHELHHGVDPASAFDPWQESAPSRGSAGAPEYLGIMEGMTEFLARRYTALAFEGHPHWERLPVFRDSAPDRGYAPLLRVFRRVVETPEGDAVLASLWAGPTQADRIGTFRAWAARLGHADLAVDGAGWRETLPAAHRGWRRLIPSG
jgi:hypothetical protein